MKSFCIPTPVKKHKPPKYSECQALEVRLLFDGDEVATAVDAQNTTNNNTNSEPASVAAIVPDVTASDAYGNEVHAVFTVHVNKEGVSSGNKSLNLDLKLTGISDKAIEKISIRKNRLLPLNQGYLIRYTPWENWENCKKVAHYLKV